MADFEARQLNASTIDPSHLLLALCKIVHLDLPALVSKELPDRDERLEESLRECRRLKNVFRAAGLDPKSFRRLLRSKSGGGRFSATGSEPLRRSKAAKQVFADAEHLAAICDCVVYPVHLLYSVLLHADPTFDEVLGALSIEKKRLQEVARREVVPHPVPPPSGAKTKTKWN